MPLTGFIVTLGGFQGRQRWGCTTARGVTGRWVRSAAPAAGWGRRALRLRSALMDKIVTPPDTPPSASVNGVDHHVDGQVWPDESQVPVTEPVSVILLAGGVGSRMRSDRPKQFLPLRGRTVSQRALDVFLGMQEVNQIIIVVHAAYRQDFFAEYAANDPRIVFADPGVERQDSVRSGLALVPNTDDDHHPHQQQQQRNDADDILVCVHDAARPLVTRPCIRACLRDASQYGAAAIGVPCKATIKESDDGMFVHRTIERKRLWEVQTPQVVRSRLLRRGFEQVERDGLVVTDDVSVVEHIKDANCRIKLTLGEYENIKLTTPEDMILAEMILTARGE